MRKPVPFGKYLLLDRISVGGMAEVFRAKSFGVEGFEKIIAVKRILPSMSGEQDFIDMFVDEAKIAGQLSHANICQLFELGKIEGTHFIAMEFVWGKDLLQIQNRFRKLGQVMPLPMACFVIARVCEGLDYAHRKRDPLGRPLNLVHRDCSPQNILVSYEGEVKIIDFGIAKAASRSSGSGTASGVLKGKFGYMSPEQVRGLALDRRSDLFAVGTMLYESITGERLFQTESDFSTLEKVRNVDIYPPSHFNRDVPRELETIVMRSLARDPDDRYQHAGDMQADLQAFLMSLPELYTPNQLGVWLKRTFATERSREQKTLERFNDLGPDGSPKPGSPASRSSSGRSTSDFDDGPTEIYGELDVDNDPAVEEVLVEGSGAGGAPRSPGGDRPGIPSAFPSGMAARMPLSVSPGRHRARGTGNHAAAKSGSADDGVPVEIPDSDPFRRTASVAVPRPLGAGRWRSIARDVGIGLGIAAVVLLLFAAGKYLFFDRGQSDAQASAAAAGTIAVTVPDLEPADVLLNGAPAGAVESGQALTLGQLAPGAYSITVRRQGVPDCVKAVNLQPGRIEVVTCAMQGPSRTGELELEAVPDGATVFLDGQQISTAAAREPLLLRAGVAHEVELRAGGELLHAIAVTVAPGERQRRSLALDSDQQARLDKALADGAAAAVAKSPRGRTDRGSGAAGKRKAKESVAEVADDSEVMDFSADVKPAEPAPTEPAVAQSAVPSTRRDGAAKDGNDTGDRDESDAGDKSGGGSAKAPAAAAGSATAEAGDVKTEAIGFLVAQTTPDARVFVDGQDTGKTTPIASSARLSVPAGKHKVTFVVDGERFSYLVDVVAGQTLRLDKTLPVGE